MEDEIKQRMKDEGVPLEMNDTSEKLMQDMVKPVVTSVAAGALTLAAAAILKKLIVTNFKHSDITGDKELKPTDDKVAISQVESSASGVDAALSKDEVTGVDGDLSAAQTEAVAATGEATALETGAAAARTKAGAADIETKALKMT